MTRPRRALRQRVARPNLLTHTPETVMGNGKKLGDFTGTDVGELAWLAEPDVPVLSAIADLMLRDGLDWATAVCLTLTQLRAEEQAT